MMSMGGPDYLIADGMEEPKLRRLKSIGQAFWVLATADLELPTSEG